MHAFQLEGNKAWDDLGNGIKRQVVIYDENTMLVKVKFETGSIGVLHQHSHVQISYVESGIFDYTIEDKVQRLKKGESCMIASNKIHGCVCVEEGVLLDVFNPMRKDFLK